MVEGIRSCADAGSVNCPCVLASCGKCPVCSRLAGKGCCDCSWQGICIYNEFLQNGAAAEIQRNSRRCRIQKKIWYEKDLAVIRLEVPRGFAEKASVPGSCVFVRAGEDPECFDMPVSVMRADYENGIIELAVKDCGPKSRRLMEADRFVWLRGIYRNGLLGVEKLLSNERKSVLCLAKGVGIAPVSNYCRWAGKRDEIEVVSDIDKVNRFFVEDCLGGCRLKKLKYDRLQIGDMNAATSDYDVIVVCASDFYQENIVIPEEKAVYSNNFTMCCGEGVCGACIYVGTDGKEHRMCKCRKK